MDGVVGSDLLDRLAATDHLHDDSGLELGAVGAGLAHRWEPLFRSGAPPQRLTMGPAQKNYPDSINTTQRGATMRCLHSQNLGAWSLTQAGICW